jgi:ribosomal protein L27
MMKTVMAIVLATGIVGTVSGRDQNLLARFDGGIGVIPVSNGAGPVNADGTFPNVKLNIVRGVPPGAGPWRISDLRAEVFTDGQIQVRGRGLLLASGNSIGQNANQSVFATLICEASAPFVERNTTTTGVPLSPNGDFRIDDTLSLVPTDCASPVLLIRNTAGQWFAAGIPDRGNN